MVTSIVISLTITASVSARTLHVGDKTFNLSQTKYTTPSLAFKIENETYYAPLAPILKNNTIHVRYKNIPFSVDFPETYPDLLVQYNCPEIFTDTVNYTYDNDGRLIGADENLYLQSTGTQYILTNFYVTTLSKATLNMKLSAKVLNERIFGYSIPKGGATNSITAFAKFYSNSVEFWANRVSSGGAFTSIIVNDSVSNKRTWTLDLKNRRASITGFGSKTLSNFNNTQQALHPFALFGATSESGGVSTYSPGMQTYQVKLYEDDVLFYHFVPVPACMRIGDFIVPENGMWDIVNQQFYGNSGTGSFIYGKDE